MLIWKLIPGTGVFADVQVDFGIHGGLSWAVKEVGDAWKRISVFLGDLVERSKVGAKME